MSLLYNFLLLSVSKIKKTSWWLWLWCSCVYVSLLSTQYNNFWYSWQSITTASSI